MTASAKLPYLGLTDTKECGCALGTVCAELQNGNRAIIDDRLVLLINQMISGHDTRREILAHLDGHFPLLISMARQAAVYDHYIREHLKSIKGPFNV